MGRGGWSPGYYKKGVCWVPPIATGCQEKAVGGQGAASSEASRGEGRIGAREQGLSSNSVPVTPHPEPVCTSKQGEGGVRSITVRLRLVQPSLLNEEPDPPRPLGHCVTFGSLWPSLSLWLQQSVRRVEVVKEKTAEMGGEQGRGRHRGGAA